MGILITGTVPRKRPHASVLFGICLLLSIGAAMTPAEAEDGPLYVAPGPSNLVSPDVIKRNQEQVARTGRTLGDLVGNSLRSPTSHATDLLVTTKCGHYLSATVTYADGSVKTLSLSNAQASQSDMDNARAAIPILRIVDLFDCDH